MSDLATLLVGTKVTNKGVNEFGDSRITGMVVRPDDDQDTGEKFVLVLTESEHRPPFDRLIRHGAKGGYTSYPPTAWLHRMAVHEIDQHQGADPFRSAGKCAQYAMAALRAACVPPNDRIGTRSHDALIEAYRVLRAEAESIRRGIA